MRFALSIFAATYTCLATGCDQGEVLIPDAQDSVAEQSTGVDSSDAPAGDSAENPQMVVHGPGFEAYHTRMISVGWDGEPAGNCWAPQISADGRYVTFVSASDTLVFPDTNYRPDLFRFDRLENTVVRITEQNGVESDGSVGDFRMTADGQIVVFTSTRTSLVADVEYRGHNGAQYFYVHDCLTGAFKAVTLPQPDGTSLAPFRSWRFALSPDGRFLLFEGRPDSSTALNQRTYRYDLSESSIAPLTWMEQFDLDELVVGRNAAVIAFTAFGEPLFIHDNGRVAHVPVLDGEFLRGESLRLSDDGSVLALKVSLLHVIDNRPNDSGIVAYKLEQGGFVEVSRVLPGMTRWSDLDVGSISSDGRFVVFTGKPEFNDPTTPTSKHVYRFDVETSALIRVDQERPPERTEPLGQSTAWSPSISANGRFVVFVSSSRNLVDGYDTLGHELFLRDMSIPINGGALP